MKKFYNISAVVLTGIAIGAFVFKQIDTETLVTVIGLIGTSLYALYQKFGKDEVVKENLILKRDVEDIATSLYKERSLNQELTNRLYIKGVDPITEDEVVVKKTRSKKVK